MAAASFVVAGRIVPASASAIGLHGAVDPALLWFTVLAAIVI
jgi:hypothetical protein